MSRRRPMAGSCTCSRTANRHAEHTASAKRAFLQGMREGGKLW